MDLLNHGINKNTITGKRHQEIGLVVPAKLVFLTDDRRCAEVLEKELIKRREKISKCHFKI